MAARKPGWRELRPGGVIREPGCSVRYRTGGWRTMRPVRDVSRCTNCLICWISCPDVAVEVRDGKVVGINLEACKGCGTCAAECPVRVERHAVTGRPGRVIQMIEEREAQERAQELAKQEAQAPEKAPQEQPARS